MVVLQQATGTHAVPVKSHRSHGSFKVGSVMKTQEEETDTNVRPTWRYPVSFALCQSSRAADLRFGL